MCSTLAYEKRNEPAKAIDNGEVGSNEVTEELKTIRSSSRKIKE